MRTELFRWEAIKITGRNKFTLYVEIGRLVSIVEEGFFKSESTALKKLRERMLERKELPEEVRNAYKRNSRNVAPQLKRKSLRQNRSRKMTITKVVRFDSLQDFIAKTIGGLLSGKNYSTENSKLGGQ